MGKLLRAEPEGSKFLEAYPQVEEALQKANWLQCIKKFKGYHKEVTKAFARSFKDKDSQVEVGDLTFAVSEGSIARATSLPQTGERWFKNRAVQDQQWKRIFKNPGMNTSVFTKGIPISHVKEEWKFLLLLVQKFFTCEGRFGVLYVYHGKIMLQFQGEHDINLPYFLFQSLRKMCSMAQRNPRNIEAYLCHHSLVKLLIEEQLKEKQDTWEKFLVRNHFEEPGESSIPRKSRRKRKESISETVQGQTVEEIEVYHPEPEIEPTEDSAQEIISETLAELAKEAAKKRREDKKKQKQDKGKSVIQETDQTLEHSNDEERDSQPLAQRLAKLHEKIALSKKVKVQKPRKKAQKETQSAATVRRSSRLQNKGKATRTLFVDLSTPEKGAIKTDLDDSPQREAATPPREDSPFQPEFETEIEHEYSPRKSPIVDPVQQDVYNYFETLEQNTAGPSNVIPHEQQIDLLKQEIYELEVLNRHIKQRNEEMKQQADIAKAIQDNTFLHMSMWQKKHSRLKKRCRRLNRALINLKFRCMFKRPKVNVSTQRKRRRLDVLAEASQQVD